VGRVIAINQVATTIDEARMTKEAISTQHESKGNAQFTLSASVIRTFIRHSDFVLRHSQQMGFEDSTHPPRVLACLELLAIFALRSAAAS
jgi:hypothetical protein